MNLPDNIKYFEFFISSLFSFEVGYKPSTIYEESVLLLLLYLHSSANNNSEDKNLSRNKILVRNDLSVALYKAERPDLVAQVYFIQIYFIIIALP